LYKSSESLRFRVEVSRRSGVSVNIGRYAGSADNADVLIGYTVLYMLTCDDVTPYAQLPHQSASRPASSIIIIIFLYPR